MVCRQVNVISRFERGTHGTLDIGDREFPFCNVIVLAEDRRLMALAGP
jgi:hypothetical protein